MCVRKGQKTPEPNSQLWNGNRQERVMAEDPILGKGTRNTSCLQVTGKVIVGL